MLELALERKTNLASLNYRRVICVKWLNFIASLSVKKQTIRKIIWQRKSGRFINISNGASLCTGKKAVLKPMIFTGTLIIILYKKKTTLLCDFDYFSHM